MHGTIKKPAIEVRTLSKRYAIGAQREPYLSLRDQIAKGATGLGRALRTGLGGGGRSARHHWALKGISFVVDQGEAVGIIGRNGAGKSTLLKILSRITPPTAGTVTVRGRVASLLEVGTGFHPELTGRENIFLNGAILGMTRAEIRAGFDEIVAFAEIATFLDTPVKRYSSGMYVRLAFAVAAHLAPEVLLVDEVLAVGDAAFQKKCLGKMGEVTKAGRTVLFVSHNMGAVRALCTRGVVLDDGECVFEGECNRAVDTYLGIGGSEQKTSVSFPVSDERGASITRLTIVDAGGQLCPLIHHQDAFGMVIEYSVRDWPNNAYVTLDLFNAAGQQIIWSCDACATNSIEARRPAGRYRSLIGLPAGLLPPGHYVVSSAIYSLTAGIIDHKEKALPFEIVDGGSFLAGLGITKFPALTAISPSWDTSFLGEGNPR